MTNIVQTILREEYNEARTLIKESLNEKIGIILEEKLMEYAPTLFEEKKKTCDCGYKNCKICGKTKK